MRTSIKNSLLFLSFVLASPLVGQNQVDKISLNWKKISLPDNVTGKTREVLFFDEAIIKNDCFMPYFQGKIPVTNNSTTLNIALIQTLYEEIHQNDLGLTDPDKINDSIVIMQQSAIDRKQKYVIYSLLPIRKNKITGKFERLTSFGIKITENSIGHVPVKLQSKSANSNTSVLSTGNWYKFHVGKSGVHQIFYSELISLGILNPENVRIYGHNGSNLTFINDGSSPSDPTEIPVMFFNGTDDIFSDGDYILFYAEGPENIRYNDTTKVFSKDVNLYNDNINYFITSNPGGKTIDTVDIVSSASDTIRTYDYVNFHEKNEVNLIKSGREFVGEVFSEVSEHEFTFDLSNLDTLEQVILISDLLARSAIQTSFNIYYNDHWITSAYMNMTDTFNLLARYATENVIKSNFSASEGNATIKIVFNNNTDIYAIGWLNSLLLQARKYLKYQSQQFTFRDTRSVNAYSTAQFNIENANGNLQIWDITNIYNVKMMNTSLQNNILSFKADVSSLKNYIVFDKQTDLLRPTILAGKIANQNLHNFENTDFLIVTHPKFKPQALELADLHTQMDQLRVKVVTTDEVYNEFSSGNIDPSAIRNYAKYLYDNAGSLENCIKYLLLFGDGSYNNKSISETFIPTYQSYESLLVVLSFVTDDYFGILDDSETIETGILDIGIGRFPVKTIEEADAILKKIKAYMSNSKGSWRNQICFLADDEDSNIHMAQADQLASYVKTNYPNFNIDKIYLDAYQQVTTENGDRYPDAHAAVLSRLNQGTLIFNFTGHGGTESLTREKIIHQIEDIQQLNNDNYPLFLAFTSNFNRFDQPTGNTGGEDVILNAHGGGVSVFSPTRYTYSGPNFTLNYKLYNNILSKDHYGNPVGIGEIIRKTKNALGFEVNKLVYPLLGDPALKLAIPEYSIQTDSINGKIVSADDTIEAYQTVTITGKITDIQGNKIHNFNGKILPILFDKEKKKETLSNDGLNPFIFKSQENVLYRGQASVKNGEFCFSFIVPYIDSVGNGKLSYYAFTDSMDATGSYTNFTLKKGIPTEIDNNGPEIQLFLNDTLFQDGDTVNSSPVLIAKINDRNGINIADIGSGHEIITYLDNDSVSPYILNNSFIFDIDSYVKGTVIYSLPEIEDGKHLLKLKAWDIYNNFSISQLNFIVDNSLPVPKIYSSSPKFYCYPNPMKTHTTFYFENNSPTAISNIEIHIFDMKMRKINVLQTKINSSAQVEQIYWEGTNAKGAKIKAGIYIYQMIIRLKNGKILNKSQKLIVID